MRNILKICLLITFCLSSSLTSNAQEENPASSPVKDLPEFKLVKEGLSEYLDGSYRVNYIYRRTGEVDGGIKTRVVLDGKQGNPLFTMFHEPNFMSAKIVQPRLRSKPTLQKRVFFNFDTSALADYPELNHRSCSELVLKDLVPIRAIGFKKTTGKGMFDLIVGFENEGLKLTDGTHYSPVTNAEYDLLGNSLDAFLREKHQVSIIPQSEGDVIGTQKHHRGGMLRFEETTVSHATRGLHKHYAFYLSNDSESPVVTCSIQKDGGVTYLKKKLDQFLIFRDIDLDGHYEWMLLGEGEADFDLINMSDPWHMKLATNDQRNAYLRYLKSAGGQTKELSQKLQEAKRKKGSEAGEANRK